jgi:hypothetical protein
MMKAWARITPTWATLQVGWVVCGSPRTRLQPCCLQADATWDAPGTRYPAHGRLRRIIVITDSADSGRTWIEQVSHLIGPDRFVVVASAQAGPMLQPYHQSGQIAGWCGTLRLGRA